MDFFRAKFFLLLLVFTLAACGGGGGGDDSAPEQSASLDPMLMPLLTVDEDNAQEDVLEQAIFALELSISIQNHLARSLFTPIYLGDSIESRSTAECDYDFQDRDVSGDISVDDVVALTLLNCAYDHAGYSIIYSGQAEVLITDYNGLFGMSVELVLDDLSINLDGVIISITGTYVIDYINPEPALIIGYIFNNLTTHEGASIEFSSGVDSFILRELLYSLEIDPDYFEDVLSGMLQDPNTYTFTHTLGINRVADTTLGATYSCPASSFELLLLSPGFPINGELLRCEGADSTYASVGVLNMSDSIADLNVNGRSIPAPWSEFVSLGLKEQFGL